MLSVSQLALRVVGCFLLVFQIGGPAPTRADERAAPPAPQRVYSVGHSFHVFMPNILSDMAAQAGVQGHQQVGVSAIGGSRVIQHWDLADDKFKAKASLTAGKVDVLTLAPIFLPDDGVEKFAALALEHNPQVRILVQELWLPYEIYTPPALSRPVPVDHDALTVDELRKRHAPYFASIDAHVRQLNEKFRKEAVFVAPVGQAVIGLREKVLAGEAPGVAKQSDLFLDPIGHAKYPLQALVAYVHYGVIYRRSPVGLPPPKILTARLGAPAADPKLVELLQQLAWKAVVEHPLSGVKAD